MASPLLGYNTNLRHKNRVVHIQTEDSGIKHPHIITHLFADGGRIVKTVKTSYAEYVGNERMKELVREMMKQQHKAMIIALRDGQFDSTLGAPQPSLAPPPASTDARRPVPAVIPPPRISGPPEKAAPGEAPPDTTRNHPLALDLDALERAAHAAGDGGALTSGGLSDLPPPPENLFRDKAVAAVREAPGDTTRPPTRGGKSGPPALPTSSPASVPPSSAPGAARYGNARPAAIFGSARPSPGKSIFGEDVISDKSLDEVILSYLSEDLEAERDE